MKKIFLVIVSFVFYFFIPSQSFAVSVSSWSDKSGNNETLLQSTSAAQPSYVSNALTGLNSVNFDGVSSYMLSSDTNFSRLTAPNISIFVVMNANNDTQAADPINTVNSAGSVFTQFLVPHASNVYFDIGSYQTHRVTSSVSGVGQNIWTAVGSDGGTALIDKNGTQIVSGAIGAQEAAYSCPLGIGARTACGAGPGFYYNGSMSEVLIYNKQLSISDYQKIEGYLAWKWGLQGNLPPTHPYKLRQPFTGSPISAITFAPSAWYDASDAATINNLSYVPVVSGNIYSGKISTWNDLSGNNENLVQKTVASQPSISYSGATNVGAVNFDGVSSYMLSSDTNFSRLTAPNISIFAVMNGNNDTQTADPINTTNSVNSVYTQLLIPYSSNIYFDIGSYQTHRVTVGTSGVGQNIWTAVGSDGGTSLIDKNGTQIVSGTIGAQEATYACPLSIGALTVCGTSPAYYYNGSMSEVLIYNKQLSISDYQKIEGYLAWRWGLQGNLPLTHPYKNRQPFGGSPLSVITTSPSAWYDANNILGSFSALLGGSFNYQTSKIYLPLGFSTGAVSTLTQYTVQPVVNYTNGQLTGLRAAGSTTDNGTTVFTAYKNGISIGTIGFTNGSKVASTVFSAPVFISANDILTLQCTTAGTIQNVGVAAEGTQQGI